MSQICEKLTLLKAPLPAQRNAKRDERNAWHTPTIWRWLKNETYAGAFHAYKLKSVTKTKSVKRPEAEWVRIEVPAIIDRELFDKAQKQMAANKYENKRNTKNEFLLRGRLKCACGYGVNCHSAIHKGRNGTGYYLMLNYECFGRRAKRGYKECPHKVHWPTRPIDALVWNWVKQLLGNDQALKDGFLRSRREARTKLDVMERDLASYRAALTELDRRYQRAIELQLQLENDDYALAILKEKLSELKTLRLQTQDAIEAIEHQIGMASAEEHDLQELNRSLEQIRQRFDTYGFEQRRMLIEKLDVRVILAVEHGERVLYVRSRVKADDLKRLSLEAELNGGSGSASGTGSGGSQSQPCNPLLSTLAVIRLA